MFVLWGRRFLAMVANPYRVVIKSEWDGCADEVEILRGFLDGLVGLLPQAWQGGSSGVRCEKLGYSRDSARSMARRVDHEFYTAYWNQPADVDEGAWQTRWRDFQR